MKVLNLLTSGSFGGIEVYCRNIGLNASYENGFCFLFGEGDVYNLMVKDGLKVYSLNEKRKITLRRYNRLKKIAKDYDIIVVHHEDPFLEAYYLLLKMTYPHKKFVQTIHSCFENYKFQGYGILKRTLCDFEQKVIVRRSNLIISVSKAVEKSYHSFLRKVPSKLRVVYNGIGSDIIEEGKNAEFKIANPVKLLFVGRLSKEKGIDILIKALSQMTMDYQLFLVGDGVERKHLEEEVNRLELNGKIFFEGFRKDVGRYLKECNIFVSPTLWESFGISIVEAMAYGRICVANAVGGVPEIIEDGENGFLSIQPTAESLKTAIERAVSCIPESNTIREKARQTAKSFSIGRACRELESVYKSVYKRN